MEPAEKGQPRSLRWRLLRQKLGGLGVPCARDGFPMWLDQRRGLGRLLVEGVPRRVQVEAGVEQAPNYQVESDVEQAL